MFEEVITTIVDILISKNKALTPKDIMEESGFESAFVIRALTMLKDLELVVKAVNKSNDTVYSMVKEIKGIHLAKAAQIGVNLASFEGYFVIDPNEKKIAIEMATQAEKIKNLDVSKRKPLMQKRSYLNVKKTDDVTENLMLLLEASSATLHEYLEKKSKKDSYLSILLNMHDQAEKSLQEYTQNMK
jgi:predicted transcriptional regulator